MNDSISHPRPGQASDNLPRRGGYVAAVGRIAAAVFSIALLISPFDVAGQKREITAPPDTAKLLRTARAQCERGNFLDAADSYLILLSQKPESFEYNYELALIYLFELNERARSIPYFRVALRNMSDTLADIYNYMGRAFQSVSQFDSAIYYYQKYSDLPPKPGVIKISMKRYLARCAEEKQKVEALREQHLSDAGGAVRALNIGVGVNSEFMDIVPRYVYNEMMLLTSARDFDYQFDQYINKPYAAMRDAQGIFQPAVRLQATEYAALVFDPEWHLTILDFTPDMNKVLYLYEESLYMREGDPKKHVEPVRMPKEVNAMRPISSGTISNDGKMLIFSAYDKKEKIWNLYETHLQTDNTWGKPVRIEVLKSPRDEQYPYLSYDGTELYFSSTGHNSQGGYDVFRSTLKEGHWQAPERLEAPVNSRDNDIWFTITPDGRRAMFSSDRPEGFGNYDIYEVNF